MNRYYRNVAQNIAHICIGSLIIAIANPASAQSDSLSPRRGDADRLRPSLGQPIEPTNTDQFSPSQELPDSNLQIRNINLEYTPVESVVPGIYNASPQKVNRSGNFSTDPLNAIPIFQESTQPSRRPQQ